MPRKERTTFIVTLPLVTSPDDVSRLRARLECARRMFNVMLQDGLRIVEAVRADGRWAAALKLPKGAARNDAFKEVREAHGFTEFAFHSLAVAHKNAAGFADRIGSHETQTIATRVFKALEQYLFGKRGRPRFKGARRPLHSLEGKNNKGMLRWIAKTSSLQVESGWTIKVRMPDLRKDEWLAAALQFKTKYCRVV
ncbi:hypothetical protein [Paraburkholderia azotifigens]|uniref:Uncharacterized protein n=1 Tax=Paraburkholderia azotifigens TaxID=2057004 RepID=A0A5C6V253_9BURK|nr:hypothetical protein [Paraburkholderia azotifigens]TXC79094.1 hypothetical protein FRZ40_32225 [Paraburkholderia azotifigens]